MTSFFLTCALLGGAVLIVQTLLGFFGFDGEHDASGADFGDHDVHGVEHGAGQGLNLFSIRAISAGTTFFGIGGLAGMSTSLGLLAAIPLALVMGGVAMVGVAVAMRAMLRLEHDGTMQIDNAIGVSGIVYLTVPGNRAGAGKVHLTLQNRMVELQAVTSRGESLPTGTRIMVVDVAAPDVVEVVPDPLLIPSEVSHAGA
jgi:hypothetical protein